MMLKQDDTPSNSGISCDSGHRRKLNINEENLKNGLAQLVLCIIKLLHELLERQAIRRIEGGALSAAEIEKLGLTLMQQGEELNRLRQAFNLEEEDLNLDLGPLGRLF
ncbi:gas vesicle protein K [Solidesulfovibrio sp. C21]|uniref:gas vesicle protein K n=1 Tax=Solidesulfovibrio sp. C21 TaxID=3398613 RepID=UPI0039FD566B